MTKNWARHARNWPDHTCLDGDYYIDVDYHTGREIAGDWVPLVSEEPRTRYDAPLAGGPQLLVNQLDKVLVNNG